MLRCVVFFLHCVGSCITIFDKLVENLSRCRLFLGVAGGVFLLLLNNVIYYS